MNSTRDELTLVPTAPDQQAPSARLQQSVKLPRPLRQRLRLWAAFLDTEISELVEEALTAYLDEMDRQRVERGLPPLPQPEG